MTIELEKKSPHGLLFLINSKTSFIMNHPTDRIAHTMAFVTPVVEHWLENKITQWVHIKVREDDRTCYFARPLVINKNIARLKAPM